MRFRLVGLLLLAAWVGMLAMAQDAPAPPPGQGPPPDGGGMGRGQGRGRGWGGGFVAGTVTEVTPDHFTVKNENGESYTVHYSANTRVVKQPEQRAGADGIRTPPEEIKAADIKVGDVIMAQGEVDSAAKSVGAVMVVKISPERAREMREMQANFGKTWLMGRVTAVNDTKVTLQSSVDNAEHTFVADENTSFRKRREPVTLADVEVGTYVRVDGAVKDGVFVATTVNVVAILANRVRPANPVGPPPQ